MAEQQPKEKIKRPTPIDTSGVSISSDSVTPSTSGPSPKSSRLSRFGKLFNRSKPLSDVEDISIPQQDKKQLIEEEKPKSSISPIIQEQIRLEFLEAFSRSLSSQNKINQSIRDNSELLSAEKDESKAKKYSLSEVENTLDVHLQELESVREDVYKELEGSADSSRIRIRAGRINGPFCKEYKEGLGSALIEAGSAYDLETGLTFKQKIALEAALSSAKQEPNENHNKKLIAAFRDEINRLETEFQADLANRETAAFKAHAALNEELETFNSDFNKLILDVGQGALVQVIKSLAVKYPIQHKIPPLFDVEFNEANDEAPLTTAKWDVISEPFKQALESEIAKQKIRCDILHTEAEILMRLEIASQMKFSSNSSKAMKEQMTNILKEFKSTQDIPVEKLREIYASLSALDATLKDKDKVIFGYTFQVYSFEQLINRRSKDGILDGVPAAVASIEAIAHDETITRVERTKKIEACIRTLALLDRGVVSDHTKQFTKLLTAQSEKNDTKAHSEVIEVLKKLNKGKLGKWTNAILQEINPNQEKKDKKEPASLSDADRVADAINTISKDPNILAELRREIGIPKFVEAVKELERTEEHQELAENYVESVRNLKGSAWKKDFLDLYDGVVPPSQGITPTSAPLPNVTSTTTTTLKELDSSVSPLDSESKSCDLTPITMPEPTLEKKEKKEKSPEEIELRKHATDMLRRIEIARQMGLSEQVYFQMRLDLHVLLNDLQKKSGNIPEVFQKFAQKWESAIIKSTKEDMEDIFLPTAAITLFLAAVENSSMLDAVDLLKQYQEESDFSKLKACSLALNFVSKEVDEEFIKILTQSAPEIANKIGEFRVRDEDNHLPHSHSVPATFNNSDKKKNKKRVRFQLPSDSSYTSTPEKKEEARVIDYEMEERIKLIYLKSFRDAFLSKESVDDAVLAIGQITRKTGSVPLSLSEAEAVIDVNQATLAKAYETIDVPYNDEEFTIKAGRMKGVLEPSIRENSLNLKDALEQLGVETISKLEDRFTFKQIVALDGVLAAAKIKPDERFFSMCMADAELELSIAQAKKDQARVQKLQSKSADAEVPSFFSVSAKNMEIQALVEIITQSAKNTEGSSADIMSSIFDIQFTVDKETNRIVVNEWQTLSQPFKAALDSNIQELESRCEIFAQERHINTRLEIAEYMGASKKSIRWSKKKLAEILSNFKQGNDLNQQELKELLQKLKRYDDKLSENKPYQDAYMATTFLTLIKSRNAAGVLDGLSGAVKHIKGSDENAIKACVIALAILDEGVVISGYTTAFMKQLKEDPETHERFIKVLNEFGQTTPPLHRDNVHKQWARAVVKKYSVQEIQESKDKQENEIPAQLPSHTPADLALSTSLDTDVKKKEDKTRPLVSDEKYSKSVQTQPPIFSFLDWAFAADPTDTSSMLSEEKDRKSPNGYSLSNDVHEKYHQILKEIEEAYEQGCPADLYKSMKQALDEIIRKIKIAPNCNGLELLNRFREETDRESPPKGYNLSGDVSKKFFQILVKIEVAHETGCSDSLYVSMKHALHAVIRKSAIDTDCDVLKLLNGFDETWNKKSEHYAATSSVVNFLTAIKADKLTKATEVIKVAFQKIDDLQSCLIALAMHDARSTGNTNDGTSLHTQKIMQTLKAINEDQLVDALREINSPSKAPYIKQWVEKVAQDNNLDLSPAKSRKVYSISISEKPDFQRFLQENDYKPGRFSDDPQMNAKEAEILRKIEIAYDKLQPSNPLDESSKNQIELLFVSMKTDDVSLEGLNNYDNRWKGALPNTRAFSFYKEASEVYEKERVVAKTNEEENDHKKLPSQSSESVSSVPLSELSDLQSATAPTTSVDSKTSISEADEAKLRKSFAHDLREKIGAVQGQITAIENKKFFEFLLSDEDKHQKESLEQQKICWEFLRSEIQTNPEAKLQSLIEAFKQKLGDDQRLNNLQQGQGVKRIGLNLSLFALLSFTWGASTLLFLPKYSDLATSLAPYAMPIGAYIFVLAIVILSQTARSRKTGRAFADQGVGEFKNEVDDLLKLTEARLQRTKATQPFIDAIDQGNLQEALRILQVALKENKQVNAAEMVYILFQEDTDPNGEHKSKTGNLGVRLLDAEVLGNKQESVLEFFKWVVSRTQNLPSQGQAFKEWVDGIEQHVLTKQTPTPPSSLEEIHASPTPPQGNAVHRGRSTPPASSSLDPFPMPPPGSIGNGSSFMRPPLPPRPPRRNSQENLQLKEQNLEKSDSDPLIRGSESNLTV